MITLADIRKKQAEHKAALTAFREKRAEVMMKKDAYHQAEMELESLSIAARNGTNELRSIGAEFALQVDDDFTPKLTGTELPGEHIWTPEDSHHPGAFDPGYPGDPWQGQSLQMASDDPITIQPVWDYKHN